LTQFQKSPVGRSLDEGTFGATTGSVAVSAQSSRLQGRSGAALSIAIIGTGIAGMSAAWLLNKRHRITVYEKEPRLGGHSNTVEVPGPNGPIAVDTGFIVYNERNYPNLTALFEHLDVPTRNSDMSFSASLDGGGLEYSGTDLNGLLGQRINIVRPRFWAMMTDLMRFYREAPKFLADPQAESLSIGDYLTQEKYGARFVEDHLLPMGAAIWSTTTEDMKAYPAKSFIRFFESHGLLSVKDRPQWRTVHGGSREYVRRLTESYRHLIRFGGVKAVRRQGHRVLVEDHEGRSEAYDHVVLATHADEAYRLLRDPDPFEKGLLGSWKYTENRAILHRDPELMPKRRRVWSSWNFIGDRELDNSRSLCVTYWMNQLQSLDPSNPLFVTLNPARDPAPEKVISSFLYTHPFFDRAALESQHNLWSLQGHRHTWYCGSYFGHGFHEDALQSGLAVAEQLGGLKRPWQVEDENGRIHISNNRRVAAA
jgi:predicted NAD/FAD-binding protein